MISDVHDTELAGICDALPPAYRQRRIPRVTTSHPRWVYLLAVLVPDPTDDLDLYGAAEPDADEVAAIARYLDYAREFYNDQWVRRMMDRPLDVVGGHNTVVLAKRASDGGWSYRRSTWTIGPRFSPTIDRPPLDIHALLDHIETIGDGVYRRWTEFKDAHPLDGYPVPAPADLAVAVTS